ncbi:hypothetical protein GCM10023085_65230 [Actinomadura viridis]|uniref:Conserved hypothetical protein CHP03032 domain-containing protein n=1 Tax=Actinomadura viridis TaxID=58110 RepID=A0A931DSI3_9ACTN|nr:DUF4915 domain-containing protein [Actinomadura viridis]MBG6093061.1 hypothetical protein [Actinomadura viridis]
MSEILVSVYGHRPDAVPRLVVIDTDTLAAREAPFAVPAGFQRCMGLSADGGRIHVLAVAADDRSSLVTLDRAGEREPLVTPLPGVMDGHSVLAAGGDLHAVSSGTNELVHFPLSGGRPDTGRRRVEWRAADAVRDTHHANSLLRREGSLLVSAFGESPTGSLRDAHDGYIVDVTGGRPAITGVSQPHSLTERGGLLYYCESGRRRFCSEKGPVVTLSGYVRGACWLSDDVVCLGTSSGRVRGERSRYETEECAVWIVDAARGSVIGRIPMAEFGPEIYDIVAL